MRRAVLALILILASIRPAAALDVVVSIKPLHSLVAAVMAGTGTPVLLLDAAADPHTYALRPSDARALKGAAVVFRVGAGLDAFLDKPLRNLTKSTRVATMAGMPGMVPLAPREGGLWEGDDDDHAHGHHQTIDPHLWLDPVNAKAFVRAAAEVLAAADAAQAETYRRNAAATLERLDRLDGEIGMLLRPLRGIPYLVFHDAFQYLEARYQLAPAGSVSIDPERQPGAKRLKALRDRIKGGGIACLFRQPQFSPKLIDTITRGLPVRVGVLDDLGAELPAGPEQYDALLRSLAAGLRDCLAG